MAATRYAFLFSGLVGLATAAALAGSAAWLVSSERLPVLIPWALPGAVVFLILAGTSLAELPLMAYALRRLAAERASHRGLVLALNGLYVAFAAVYGGAGLVLTGQVGWGLALCGLAGVRFISSQLFVYR